MLCADILLLAFAWGLSNLVRFDFSIPAYYEAFLLKAFPLVIVSGNVALYQYRGSLKCHKSQQCELTFYRQLYPLQHPVLWFLEIHLCHRLVFHHNPDIRVSA